MERSLEGRFAEGLRTRFPRARGLQVTPGDDRFDVGLADGSKLLTLGFAQGEWTVWNADGHAHRNEFAEAMELAVALLAGEARFGTEYRGETLSATWLESWDGEAFEMTDVAAFLSPFEADEWTLWPGEAWRVVRRTTRLDTEVEVEEFERTYEEPISGGPSMLPALENALGTLGGDLRWAVDGQSRFVYPAPHGWRRHPIDDRKAVEMHNMTEFAPPEEGLRLRKRCYFREDTTGTTKTDAQTFRPLSVERGLPEPEPMTQGWSRHAWTLLFSDGEDEMMGILELFFVEATRPRATRLWEAFERILKDARYVPGAWTMTQEP